MLRLYVYAYRWAIDRGFTAPSGFVAPYDDDGTPRTTPHRLISDWPPIFLQQTGGGENTSCQMDSTSLQGSEWEIDLEIAAESENLVAQLEEEVDSLRRQLAEEKAMHKQAQNDRDYYCSTLAAWHKQASAELDSTEAEMEVAQV